MINYINAILNKKKRLAVGLMSGTSLDGIDACIVEIEGNYTDTKIRQIAFNTYEYTKEEKMRIANLCNKSTATVDEICYMNTYLGDKFGQAVIDICKEANVDINSIDFVSSHGQTIFHIPDKHSTLQIGELSNISAITGRVCVGDFRPSDMAYGGQGAPLVPYFDYICFSHNKKGRVLLNLGGIANITVLKAGGNEKDVWAFDTGPSNVIIDEIVKIITDGEKKYDDGGHMALKGNADDKWLDEILNDDDYIKIFPPKSTGREHYTAEYTRALYENGKKRGLSDLDILATITKYTSYTIYDQLKRFVLDNCCIDEIYASGGGCHNQMIMDCLREYTRLEVKTLEGLSFSSDAKEAIAFAVLGNEFLSGHSNNVSSATGANRSVVMGKLVLPSQCN